jgi:hypothetical protein
MESKTAYKAITVILDKDGTTSALAKKLKEEKGLITGNILSARGTGSPLTKRSFLHQTEKELFTIVVPEQQSDEIFEFIYRECEMGERDGGFMYQASLGRSSEFALPDLEG